MYDLIVVGAGPGGSSTALHAAKLGLKVLVLEKKQQIGSPVQCAEGIGKNFPIPIKRKWVATEIKEAVIYGPFGAEARIPGEGYILERRIFDRDLAAMAADAGAEIHPSEPVVELKVKPCCVEVKTPERTYVGRLVVGADGPNSTVAKFAGIDTSVGPRDIDVGFEYFMTNVRLDMDKIYLWFGRNVAPGGYVWVFPKGEGRANVGIGIQTWMAHKSAQAYLHQFLDTYLPDARVVEVTGGLIPVTPLKTAVADRVMLVGDAAHQADPLTGGGIKNAVVAGKIAAEVAAEAVEADMYSRAFLKKYDERWKKELNLERSWKLKEALLDMEDDELEEGVKVLAEAQGDIWKALKAALKHPKLMVKLLKYFK